MLDTCTSHFGPKQLTRLAGGVREGHNMAQNGPRLYIYNICKTFCFRALLRSLNGSSQSVLSWQWHLNCHGELWQQCTWHLNSDIKTLTYQKINWSQEHNSQFYQWICKPPCLFVCLFTSEEWSCCTQTRLLSTKRRSFCLMFHQPCVHLPSSSFFFYMQPHL